MNQEELDMVSRILTEAKKVTPATPLTAEQKKANIDALLAKNSPAAPEVKDAPAPEANVEPKLTKKQQKEALAKAEADRISAEAEAAKAVVPEEKVVPAETEEAKARRERRNFLKRQATAKRNELKKKEEEEKTSTQLGLNFDEKTPVKNRTKQPILGTPPLSTAKKLIQKQLKRKKDIANLETERKANLEKNKKEVITPIKKTVLGREKRLPLSRVEKAKGTALQRKKDIANLETERKANLEKKPNDSSWLANLPKIERTPSTHTPSKPNAVFGGNSPWVNKPVSRFVSGSTAEQEAGRAPSKPVSRYASGTEAEQGETANLNKNTVKDILRAKVDDKKEPTPQLSKPQHQGEIVNIGFADKNKPVEAKPITPSAVSWGAPKPKEPTPAQEEPVAKKSKIQRFKDFVKKGIEAGWEREGKVTGKVLQKDLRDSTTKPSTPKPTVVPAPTATPTPVRHSPTAKETAEFIRSGQKGTDEEKEAHRQTYANNENEVEKHLKNANYTSTPASEPKPAVVSAPEPASKPVVVPEPKPKSYEDTLANLRLTQRKLRESVHLKEAKKSPTAKETAEWWNKHGKSTPSYSNNTGKFTLSNPTEPIPTEHKDNFSKNRTKVEQHFHDILAKEREESKRQDTPQQDDFKPHPRDEESYETSEKERQRVLERLRFRKKEESEKAKRDPNKMSASEEEEYYKKPNYGIHVHTDTHVSEPHYVHAENIQDAREKLKKLLNIKVSVGDEKMPGHSVGREKPYTVTTGHTDFNGKSIYGVPIARSNHRYNTSTKQFEPQIIKGIPTEKYDPNSNMILGPRTYYTSNAAKAKALAEAHHRLVHGLHPDHPLYSNVES